VRPYLDADLPDHVRTIVRHQQRAVACDRDPHRAAPNALFSLSAIRQSLLASRSTVMLLAGSAFARGCGAVEFCCESSTALGMRTAAATRNADVIYLSSIENR